MPGDRATDAHAVPRARPHIRLFAERVVVTRTEGLAARCDEVLAPLVELSFDYGGTRVRAADERERIFRADRGGLVAVPRDSAFERDARRILERSGAVELACLDDLATPPGCEADYAVRMDGDAHAHCAFTADVLPRFRALGWDVEICPAYPFQVASDAHRALFTASVDPDEALPDWFSLELGVEVDGARVDLLPVILAILDDADELSSLRALAGRRAAYALRVSDTHHVTLQPDRLLALARVVIELYNAQERRLVFPPARVGALARLESALTDGGAEVAIRDPARLVARGRAIGERPRRAIMPSTLQATLRPYQEEGVAFLGHLAEAGSGGVLADDMGLGKTLQTIAHVCAEKAAGRMRAPVLVVAPTSLVGNWVRELARFAPHLKIVVAHGAARAARFAEIASSDVVITTYPLVVRDEPRLASEAFSLVVLDEAQAIKNVRSQAHRAVAALRAERRVCLSGTPVENDLGELWAIFELVAPGLLGDELSFRRAYRQPIEQRGDGLRVAALRELVAPLILRREKRDVARDLPPKTELPCPVELTGAQRDLYEQIRVAAHADVRKAIRAKGLAASTIPILGALMKLRQVCCDPRLVPLEAVASVAPSAKLDALLELLARELAAGHRALVFSQFASMLTIVSAALTRRGVRHVMLTGQTADRARVVDAFEGREADVFLISLKAGGTGLNLTSADTVVHYDPWWNPAAHAQATDRAHRIGQSRPVFVYNLFVAGSVEERVIRLQQRKRWLANALLGSGDAALAGRAEVGEEDVEALLAPLDAALDAPVGASLGRDRANSDGVHTEA